MSATPKVAPTRHRKAKTKHLTWEYPTGSGIKIAEMPNRTGGQVFGVSYHVRIPAELLGVPGRREMHQRKTKVEAERLAEDRMLALRQHGTEFSKIPATAQKQAALAWGELDARNKEKHLDLNFLDVFRAGLRTLSPAGGPKTVSGVLAELTESKESRVAAGSLDPSTVHDFKVRGARIAKVFGERMVGAITRADVADWLKDLQRDGSQFGGKLSPRSVRNYRNTLSEVFRHAKARRYCSENPFEQFTREDLKGLGGEANDRSLGEINILEVAEARNLLKAAHATKDVGLLGSTILRLFCGVRTTEVCRLDWSEVHWLEERPFVHIPLGKAKKRRVRLIEIPENALAWLKVCDPPARGPIIPGTGDSKKDTKAYCKRFGRVAKAAKITAWENNDTRHSFGSYHFALHGNALETSRQLGHKQSDEVLFAHYRALVRPEQAMEFFGLVPPLKADNLVRFPAQTA